MATRREVELIIRARDQAKSAVDKVTSALNDLAQTQDRVGQSSGRANTLLDRLSGELQNLQRQSAGLTALNRVASQLDRASTAVGRLEQNVGRAREDFDRLGRSAADASANFSRVEENTRQAGLALDRQKQSLAATRAEQARLNNQVNLAGERYKELRAQLLSSSGASEQLKQSVRDQQSVLLQLVNAQVASNQAVQRQRDAVRQAQASYSALEREVRSAGTELDRANVRFEKASAVARAEAEALEQARAELAQIRGVANQAAESLGGVEVRQEAIADASRKTAEAISTVTAALARQQQTVRSAASAGGGGAAAQATAAFRAQVDAVRQAEAAWRSAQQAANRLGTEIARTEGPTAELRAEFAAAKATSIEARQSYEAQRAALAALRAETRAALAASQARRTAEREAATLAAFTADAEFRKARAEQSAAIVARLLRVETDQLNNSLRRTAAAGAQGAAGIRTFGDQSRRALSITQRVRGEFLALTTSVFGLYAAVTQIGGVISALRSVEAAASRLNAVFGGDQSRIRSELQFLSQEADRLGLSFQVLAQEYGRFAIAASAANFSAEATREIFVSVAEAARVNKVSTEELEGTYLALQQIISKGVVSMEELRRQLGDRLPGAFNIFADALGVSTAELNDMIKQGQVLSSEDTLLKFSRELEARFGGALPAALRTTTTEIDRFSNNLFEAQKRIAEGGFADALRDVLVELNEQFRSREGRDFFLSIGSLLGNLVRALGFVAQNIDLVFLALQGLVSLKVGVFLGNFLTQGRAAALVSKEMAAAFLTADAALQKQIITQAVATNATGAFVASLRILSVTATQAGVAIVTTGVRSAATATAIAGLRTAFSAAAVAARGLLVSLGPIGLAIAAASAAAFLLSGAFVDSATKIPDATRALDEHTRQLDIYAREVGDATRAGREFNATLVELSAIDATANLTELRDAMRATRQEAIEAGRDVTLGFLRAAGEGAQQDPLVRRVLEVRRQLEEGQISVKQYQDRLEELFQETDNVALTRFISQLKLVADDAKEVEEALGSQALIAQQLGVNIGDLAGKLEAMGVTLDAGTGEIKTFNDELSETQRLADIQADALGQIESGIDRISKARERAQQFQDLDALGAKALTGVTDPAEIERINALIQERRDLLQKEFDEEDERDRRRGQRLDKQGQFNDDLRRAVELRRFEVTLIGQAQREQTILREIFTAQQKAQEDGIAITQEQIAAIRESVGAAYDAAEAERVRNLTLEQQAELRELLGQATDIQAKIEREAREQNIDLLTEEGRAWEEVTRKVYEREEAERQLKQQVEDVRALERQRLEAVRDLRDAENNGESREALEERRAALEQMAQDIITSRDAAIELARALGDEKAVATLQKINTELDIQNEKLFRAKDINEDISQGFGDVVDAFGEAIAAGEGLSGAFEAAGIAFRQFAADFLREIARMIAQALALRAIQASGFGNIFAGVGNAVAGVAHAGGRAGYGLPSRRVRPEWFVNARRMHDGGVVGLRSNEVPTVLKRGEEVLTENDARHTMNGGGAPMQDIKVINAWDVTELLSQALSTKEGQRAIINYIRDNKTAVNGALS